MNGIRLATLFALSAAALTTSCKSNQMKIERLPYPETPRGEVVDNYFGTEVADPYRWLEDDNSEATAAWVEAENAVTQDYLRQIPYRDAIRERLTELWNYPKQGSLSRHGDYYYYFYNDGLQNQSVLHRTAIPPPRARCSSIPTAFPTTARWPLPTSLSRRTAATWPMPPPLPARTGWRSA